VCVSSHFPDPPPPLTHCPAQDLGELLPAVQAELVPQLEANLLSWKALEPEEAAAKAAAAAATAAAAAAAAFAAAAEERSPTCDAVESQPARGDAPGNPWPPAHPPPIAAAGGAGGGRAPRAGTRGRGHCAHRRMRAARAARPSLLGCQCQCAGGRRGGPGPWRVAGRRRRQRLWRVAGRRRRQRLWCVAGRRRRQRPSPSQSACQWPRIAGRRDAARPLLCEAGELTLAQRRRPCSLLARLSRGTVTGLKSSWQWASGPAQAHWYLGRALEILVITVIGCMRSSRAR
jgi:hypothetical protein